MALEVYVWAWHPDAGVKFGLAAAVPDAVRVLDAVGWPLVFVETVGVGQIEVDVAGHLRHSDRRAEPGLGRRGPGQ